MPNPYQEALDRMNKEEADRQPTKDHLVILSLSIGAVILLVLTLLIVPRIAKWYRSRPLRLP